VIHLYVQKPYRVLEEDVWDVAREFGWVIGHHVGMVESSKKCGVHVIEADESVGEGTARTVAGIKRKENVEVE
jgi:hypothetical protein